MHTVSAAGIILAVLCICSVCADLMKGKIYNFITFPAMLAGLFLRLSPPAGREMPADVRLWAAFLSLILPAAVLCPFWKKGRLMGDKGLSAGDIKLFMAISVLMERKVFLQCFVLSFLGAAGIATALLLASRGRRRTVHMALPAAAAVLIHLGGIY